MAKKSSMSDGMCPFVKLHGKIRVPHHPRRAHGDECARIQHLLKMACCHESSTAQKDEIEFFFPFDLCCTLHELECCLPNEIATNATRFSRRSQRRFSFGIDHFHADRIEAGDSGTSSSCRSEKGGAHRFFVCKKAHFDEKRDRGDG